MAVWDAQRGHLVPEVSLTELQADIAALAQVPHPLGSEEIRQQRQRLAEQLTGYGLDVSIQRERVHYRHPGASGPEPRVAWVENIVAVRAGRAGADTLVVMSHYDSVWQGPGAADAGSGVAAVLAAARAVESQPTLENTMVFLLTDGEEMGLFGAQAFFREHPLAPEVDLVLNFEARGNAGPPQMFQTSEGNAALIQSLNEVLGATLANSLSFEIYRFMPNDTDLTISLGEDIPGLNFAFIDGFPHYHSQTDRPRQLSTRSLQQQAQIAVQLTQHFANTDLSIARGTANSTYFNLTSRLLLHYSLTLAHVVAGLTVLLFLAGWARGFSTQQYNWRDLGAAFATLLAICLVVSNLFEGLTDLAISQVSRRDADFWRFFYLYKMNLAGGALVTLGGVVWLCRRLSVKVPWLWVIPLLGGLVALSWQAGRLVPGAIAAAGALLLLIPGRAGIPSRALVAAGGLVWALATVGLALTLPHASYVAACLAAGAGLVLFTRPGTAAAGWVQWLWLPAIVIWSAVIYNLYLGLGVFLPQLPLALLALLVALIFAPIAPRASAASTAAVAAGATIIALSWYQFGFSDTEPQPSDLFVLTDEASGNSRWASMDPQPPTWAQDLFRGAEPQAGTTFTPTRRSDWWLGEQLPSPAPALGFARVPVENSDEIRLRSTASTPGAWLYFDPAENVRTVRVDGEPVLGLENRLRLFGMPAGAELEIRTDGPLEVTWLLARPGRGAAAPERPDSYMPTPGSRSDTLLWRGQTSLADQVIEAPEPAAEPAAEAEEAADAN